MLLSNPSLAALQLAVFAIGVMSQDPPANFFLAAETVIASLPSGCYSLPIQTDSAIKISYNNTADVGLEGPIDFYLSQDEEQTFVYGFRDPATQQNMLFDASDRSQMGIHYPDQSAIVVNSSGITFIAPDCSTVVSLVVPDFFFNVMLAGGFDGGTKKSRRGSHPNKRGFLDNVPFDVTVPIVDYCGRPPQFEPELACGQSPCNFQDQTAGVFRWTCLYPGEFSPEAFCEGAMIQLLQSITNGFLGSGTFWSTAGSVFSQYLPPAISILFGPPGSVINWIDLMNAVGGLLKPSFAASIFSTLTIEDISTAICQAHFRYQLMVVKVIDEGPGMRIPWIIAKINEAPSTTIEYETTVTIEGNNPWGCVTTTEPALTTSDTTTTTSSTETDTSTTTGTATQTFPTTLNLSDILETTTSQWVVSVIDVNTEPLPSPTMTCTVGASCDSGHVVPCGYDAQPDGTQELSGCGCGVNGQGRQRCYKQFNPFLDPAVRCFGKNDCPGDMDCWIQNVCWHLGQPGEGPGMCLKICVRAWETGN